MKKLIAIICVLSLVSPIPTAFSQMPVAASGATSMPATGLQTIGVVAATKGKVEVATTGQAGRVVQSGEAIYIGDIVKTDDAGHLQILLRDQTVFTIGPNSAITIDKFIYDPASDEGKMEASVTKGIFRYVSGKIAAKKPENVQIHLPNATIGIRGTIIAGEVGPQGSMAMLLGPGAQNDAGATIGSFVMNGTGEGAGDQEHVNRTGYGVEVNSAGSVSDVFQVPEARVHQLAEGLVPSSEGQGNGRGDGEPSGRGEGDTTKRAGPGNNDDGGGPGSDQGDQGNRPDGGKGEGQPMGPRPMGNSTIGPRPDGSMPPPPNMLMDPNKADMGPMAGAPIPTIIDFIGPDGTGPIAPMLDDFTDKANTLAQASSTEGAIGTHNARAASLVTTLDQMNQAHRLNGMGNGLYHFEGTGSLSHASSGALSSANSFSFLVDINFPDVDTSSVISSVGGGSSRVVAQLGSTQLTYDLKPVNMWQVGENPFQFAQLTPTNTSYSTYVATIDVKVLNSSVPTGNPIQDIGTNASVNVVITNGSESISGVADSTVRLQGPSPS